jgi:hypothetical protein
LRQKRRLPHKPTHNRPFEASHEKQYAATALRIAYSQALETFFALLCATIQAPDCVIGWMLKYRVYELEDLVKKIRERRKIYSKFRADRFMWEVIAEIIFMYFRTGDDQKDEAIRKNFSGLWRRLSSDFVMRSTSMNTKASNMASELRWAAFISRWALKMYLEYRRHPRKCG